MNLGRALCSTFRLRTDMKQALFPRDKSIISSLYGRRKHITNFKNIYKNATKQFYLIDRNGKCLATNVCAELIGNRVREQAVIGGIKNFSIGYGVKTGGREKAIAFSEYLHQIEDEIGIPPHTVRCYRFTDTDPSAIWAFVLDKEWYTAPPVLSYIIKQIRYGLSGQLLLSTEQIAHAQMLKMLRKRKPSEIFSTKLSDNWGTSGDPTTATYTYVYGVVRFMADVTLKYPNRIDSKFTNNKVFK